MKTVLLLLCTFILLSCHANKKAVESEYVMAKGTTEKELKLNTEKPQKSPLVIYDSHTRGYHFTATVYDTHVTLVKEYNGKPQTIEVKSEDIDALKEIISEMVLEEIHTYEAPTKKRHYDGAPHTSISVFRNDEKFSSQIFDGGFPPEALAVLVNKVLSLSAEK